MSFAVLNKPKDSNAITEHQQMYLFVYKTTHINGRYYIGRHQTENLDDGYLGSGKWVTSIKDKSSLSREIIAETNSIEELHKLEEYYIEMFWEDPLCMNMIKGSNGLTSEDALRMIQNKVNPWKTRADGTSISSDKVKNGTHNLLKNKGTVTCYDKSGNYIRISQEIYNSQQGSKSDWEFVNIRTIEGRKRKCTKSREIYADE